MEFVDIILIMIYSGMRIGELLILETKNIDLENGFVKGGIKTKAGKNRMIPLNSKIIDFVKKRYNKENKYFIQNAKGEMMKYENFLRERWGKIMEQLQMEHLPHDCRHTFATLMDNAGANKLSVKRIMGHASQDITDKVYTHKDLDELKKAIELI